MNNELFTIIGGSSSILLIKENQENPLLLLMVFTHSYSVRESSNPGLTPNPSPRRGELKNRE